MVFTDWRAFCAFLCRSIVALCAFSWRILTWPAHYASLPLACHAVRRLCSRRDQFYCRWRDAADVPCADLAWPRSASCKWDQHGCALARTFRRTVWLPKITGKQFHDPASTRANQYHRRRVRRVAPDSNAVTCVCPPRTLPHSFRDAAFHVARRNQQAPPARIARR